jgi:hypothetical protein
MVASGLRRRGRNMRVVVESKSVGHEICTGRSGSDTVAVDVFINIYR